VVIFFFCRVRGEGLTCSDRTKHATDYREQIDLATELPAPADDEPRYRRLRGPNQWPSDELIPGFRETITKYIERMTVLSTEFTSLVCWFWY
jgi:isopenicillin N synthase-like dioxygenase